MAHDESPPDKETTYREIRDRLADRRQVAILWDAEDVRAVRPDLDGERAWQVLQRVEHGHDGDRGVTWETIEATAQALFPGPEAVRRADGPPNVAGDVYAALMTRLESAAEEFVRLARTPEQAAFAERFAAFVAGDAHDSLRYLTGRAVAADRPDAAPDLPDEIGLGWSIEDVRDLRPDLDDDQCRRVLHQVALRHDASVGITWDTIEDAADDLFPPAPPPSPGAAGPESSPFDVVELIMAHDAGELDGAGEVVLFQHLVDTGLAWQLQGHYGRTAQEMLESGRIHPPGTKLASVPSIADIFADPTRYLAPEPPNGPGTEPGRSRGRSH